MAEGNGADTDRGTVLIVTREIGWFSATTSVVHEGVVEARPRWKTWPMREIIVSASAVLRARESLIAELAGLEPPVTITDDDISIIVRSVDAQTVEVNAVCALDEAHPHIAQSEQALREAFESPAPKS